MLVVFVKTLLKNHPRLYNFCAQTRSVLKQAAENHKIIFTCRNWTSNPYVRSMLKVLLTPYCLLKYFYVKSDDNRSGLAFVLIAKNEAPYIEEWLNFHRKQGVSHFIIYNNESTDNFREVLQPYIDSGLVSYHVINGKPRQLDAYNMAIHDYGHKFRYRGFIDADECVFVRNNTYRGGGARPLCVC